MGSLSPLVIVLFIVLIVAFVGAMIAYVRSERTYRGYKDIAAEARRVRSDINGELFRDGDDLVISGNYQGKPTVVRFSYGEHTPGMNVKMEAASTINLFVVPRGSRDSGGRAEIKTGDNLFDSRFTLRTDNPSESRMLLGTRGSLGELRKLCCSSRTFFSLSRGNVEVSELTIPPTAQHQHLMEHIESLHRIAEALQEMPGAEKVRIKPITRQKHVFGRVAIAAGVVAAIIAISAAVKYSGKPEHSEINAEEKAPEGMTAEEAAIVGVRDERLATESDFNGDAVAWLHTQNQSVAGKVPGNFSGGDDADDLAYIFKDPKGTYRVILVAHGKPVYDERFPFVGIATRVPKARVSTIDWVGRPPETPDGDGLLILRKPDDRASGLVIFLQGSRVVTAVPSNYQAIHLE
jgi:hypothetical protein